MTNISEGIETWAMDAAENDSEKAAALISRFEKEINRKLPAGSYIDMKTCEPIGTEIDQDTWEQILLEAGNKVALEEST